jgi:hypothetical protein
MTTECIYHPEFDAENNYYIDKAPFVPHQRNAPMYRCNCDLKTFGNLTQYKAHINKACHKNYIRNYRDSIKEFMEATSYIKQLQIDLGKMSQENLRLKKMLKEYENKKMDYNRMSDELD